MEIGSVSIEYDGAWWHVKMNVPKEAHQFGLTPVQQKFSTMGPDEGFLDQETMKEMRQQFYSDMYDLIAQLDTICIDEPPRLFDVLADDETYVRNGPELDI